jgi:dimethylhistidine N-methyltransferase
MTAPDTLPYTRRCFAIANDVWRGLTATPKSLPPHLFYDDAGSRLYERITELREYYPTRAEREIFEARAGDIVARATSVGGASLPHPLGVVELGAGSASKTEVLLRALLRRQSSCVYVPIDVSRGAIDEAKRRLAASLPRVVVRPLVMTNEQGLRALRRTAAPQLVLFIGSSIGNLTNDESTRLLRDVRRALGPQTALVLGTDLRKSSSILLPAYDDAAGVTAAFNKNVLVRINRELGGHFDLDRFRHVARWNEGASRIEMHLESTMAQEVAVDDLGLAVRFGPGETIHTESSTKYDLPHVERLLAAGGFRLQTTYHDDQRRFAVHLAQADVGSGVSTGATLA